jgi:hypothetical protein
MMKRYVAILVGVVGLVMTTTPAIGQGTILFRAPSGATTWNQSSDGWWEQTDAYGQRWSRAHLAGAGPQGQNILQLTETPGTGQHGWGWHGHVVPDLAQGGTRFYRWRHRVTSASNCAHTPSNKLLVIAQGCPGGQCRVIVQPKCNPSRMVQYNFQVDGGVYQKETGYIYPVGTWLNIQLETRTSSTASSGDGALRLWVNNNNYSSPTISNTGIVLNSGGVDGSYIIFGGYNNSDSMPSGASNVQQYADFEIGTAFHSGWNGGGTTPPPTTTAPAAPSNVRVLTSN